MKNKTTRVRFSKEDLVLDNVQKAAEKAEKAADKADKAKARLPSQKKAASKLRAKKISAEAESAKLRFGTAEVSPVNLEGPKRPLSAVNKAGMAVSASAHAKTAEYENDNVGVEALNETEGMAATTGRTVQNMHYSRKLRQYEKAEKLEAKADRANIDALAEKAKAEDPASSTNPVSRWRQKQAIKQEYAAAKAGRSAGTAAGSSTAAGGTRSAEGAAQATERGFAGIKKKAKDLGEKAFIAVKENPHIILIGGILAIIVLVISSSLSSCSAMLSGSGNVVLATSFTATDEDIRGAEADYCALEAELRERILKIQEENPDYDEYEIDTGEINHNPYELAAFLTVLYEDYTREEVQRTLREIFEAQYEYSTSHRTETVTETKQVRVGESLGQVVTSGYCNCPICCGRWSGGPTASGVYPTADHTIAVDANNPFVPMGTKVIMNGTEYTVEDTGNFDRYGVQFDVYYDDHWTDTPRAQDLGGLCSG